ncbi:hypothetical protein [Photobacterium leiognathi]|uniref:hypothetical protein n=1 Tax=Photobacterium leiognathi TaxID=553611 RepID=UPI002982A873|nr:hypothetical protein [Photobacterium leiognathi]
MSNLLKSALMATAGIAGQINAIERKRENWINAQVDATDRVDTHVSNDGQSILVIDAKIHTKFSNKLNVQLCLIEPVFNAFRFNGFELVADNSHIVTERPIAQAMNDSMVVDFKLSQNEQEIKDVAEWVKVNFLKALSSTAQGQAILDDYTHVIINTSLSFDHVKCQLGNFNFSLLNYSGDYYHPAVHLNNAEITKRMCSLASKTGDAESVLLHLKNTINIECEQYRFCSNGKVLTLTTKGINNLLAVAVFRFTRSAQFRIITLTNNETDEQLITDFENAIIEQSRIVDDVWLNGIDEV